MLRRRWAVVSYEKHVLFRSRTLTIYHRELFWSSCSCPDCPVRTLLDTYSRAFVRRQGDSVVSQGVSLSPPGMENVSLESQGFSQYVHAADWPRSSVYPLWSQSQVDQIMKSCSSFSASLTAITVFPGRALGETPDAVASGRWYRGPTLVMRLTPKRQMSCQGIMASTGVASPQLLARSRSRCRPVPTCGRAQLKIRIPLYMGTTRAKPRGEG